MHIKKIFTSVATGALILAPYTSAWQDRGLYAGADADNGYTAEEIGKSEIKPEITIDKIELTLEEAKTDPVQTVNISVKNAEGKYSITGIHVYWDERLECDGGADKNVKIGKAVSELESVVWDLENGFFATTAGVGDYGKDGVMYSVQLRIPDSASEGDVYPIKIVYEENEYCSDLFTNSNNDKTGMLMQAWTFTEGIEDGYILIKNPPVTTTTTTTSATTTTMTTATSTATSSSATSTSSATSSTSSSVTGTSSASTTPSTSSSATATSSASTTSSTSSSATATSTASTTASTSYSTTVTSASSTAASTSSVASTTTTSVTTAPPQTVQNLGDVNNDNRVDARDASMVLRLYADISSGERNVTEDELKVCDTNRNGKIEAVDASFILAFYADSTAGYTGSFVDYIKERGIDI